MPIQDDLEPIILSDDAYIFARRGVYYLRINLPKRQQFIRSLKEKVDRGKEAEVNAISKARSLYREVRDRMDLGIPIKKHTVARLCEIFLKDGREGTQVNLEAGKKIAKVMGGKGFWSKPMLSHTETTIREYILPFFTRNEYSGKSIDKITQRDIDQWIAWRAKKFPDETPSTYAHRNTTMRHLFRLAQRIGERFEPPKIDDIPKEISRRRRPEISEDQYMELLSYVRGRYSDNWEWQNKYAYLFYQWLETLNHTGIRPFNSQQNAIKMEQIRRTVVDGDERLTLERYEKDKEYIAVASPYWARTLDRLEVFYNQHGISKDREYLFVHPETINGNKIIKGEPIQNFRRQWSTAMKHLGWNEGKTEQRERIAPYSIRHRYAGRRLLTNDITPIELAQIMGTSLEMISAIYRHYTVEQHYGRLTKGDLEANIEVDYFHPKKGYREGSCERNSMSHRIHYALWPETIETPDNPFTKAELKKALEKKGDADLIARAEEAYPNG